jgi:hypothetical protein
MIFLVFMESSEGVVQEKGKALDRVGRSAGYPGSPAASAAG